MGLLTVSNTEHIYSVHECDNEIHSICVETMSAASFQPHDLLWVLRVIALMRSEKRDSRHCSMTVSRNDCWLSGHCQDISLNVLANPIMSAWVFIDANYSADIREIRCSQTGFLLGLGDWKPHYFCHAPFHATIVFRIMQRSQSLCGGNKSCWLNCICRVDNLHDTICPGSTTQRTTFLSSIVMASTQMCLFRTGAQKRLSKMPSFPVRVPLRVNVTGLFYHFSGTLVSDSKGLQYLLFRDSSIFKSIHL